MRSNKLLENSTLSSIALRISMVYGDPEFSSKWMSSSTEIYLNLYF
jgi:hypothetical protein